MVTRRTTMKSRKAPALPAARESIGKSREALSTTGAQAAEMYERSAAAVGARIGAVEKKVQRASRSAASVMRGSMEEAAAAGKVVRSSMKTAVAAVKRATRRVAKRISTAARAARAAPSKPAARTGKRTAKRASRSAAA